MPTKPKKTELVEVPVFCTWLWRDRKDMTAPKNFLKKRYVIKPRWDSPTGVKRIFLAISRLSYIP